MLGEALQHRWMSRTHSQVVAAWRRKAQGLHAESLQQNPGNCLLTSSHGSLAPSCGKMTDVSVLT